MATGASTSSWGPFEEGPVSIEERISETGRARQDHVWSVYVREENVTAQLYDENGYLVKCRLCVCVGPCGLAKRFWATAATAIF